MKHKKIKAQRKTVPVQLVRTPEEVYADLVARGVNISEWSRDHGFSRYTVLDLLRGKRVGRRGEAHKAAIALGLKQDPELLAA